MDKHARNAWMINLALVVSAAVIVAVKEGAPRSTVHAAGGGWETNGVMANALDLENERVVIVNTDTKNVAVYKTTEAGQLRLVGARDYKWDMLFKNTAALDKVEKNGGATYMDVVEFYNQDLARREHEKQQ